MIWGFLLHVIGADSSSTRWYYFWSAFGSGPLAWCVLPGVYLRHHNCHEPWCFRLGRHQYPDGAKYCRRHAAKPVRGAPKARTAAGQAAPHGTEGAVDQLDLDTKASLAGIAATQDSILVKLNDIHPG